MSIQKQEFYEGAALHRLVCSAQRTLRIALESPLLVFDERLQVHFKHSTKKTSPWGFTFTPDEQAMLEQRARRLPLVIGLICGSDGIAALAHADYVRVAPRQSTALRIACWRRHREHFEISGPSGALPSKVAPSDWDRLLTWETPQ